MQNNQLFELFLLFFYIFKINRAFYSKLVRVNKVRIFIWRYCYQNCRKGRKTIVKKENVFITHRIEQINEDSIIAKGDNNNTEDEPIKKDEVIGKVVFISKASFVVCICHPMEMDFFGDCCRIFTEELGNIFR